MTIYLQRWLRDEWEEDKREWWEEDNGHEWTEYNRCVWEDDSIVDVGWEDNRGGRYILQRTQ